MRLIPPINRKVKIAVVTLGRLLLGISMIMTGFLRACNPVISSQVVGTYLEAAGMGFFKPLSLLLAIAFAAFEFAIGVGSLLGTNIKKTSLYTVLVIGFLTPFSFYTAYISTVVSDNQIAGLQLSDKGTFWTYLVSLIIAINLYIWREYSKTIFTNRTQWTIGPTCMLYSVFVSAVSYLHLPMVDLTPYQPGVSMSTFMVPEKLTEKDFIWDENGHFAVPSPRKIALNADCTKETNALQLYSAEEGDVTQKILGFDGYTFLLIADDLSNTSTSSRHEINDLYDYCRDNDYQFYCLTTSNAKSAETDEYCVESGGAEYPFLNADRRELRKIVQSRPGLILLKDGVICKKWSNFNMPAFDKRIEETDMAEPQEVSMRHNALTLFAQLTLILLFILAIDWLLGLLKWIFRRLFGKSGKAEATKQETEQKEETSIASQPEAKQTAQQ